MRFFFLGNYKNLRQGLGKGLENSSGPKRAQGGMEIPLAYTKMNISIYCLKVRFHFPKDSFIEPYFETLLVVSDSMGIFVAPLSFETKNHAQ